MRRMTWPEWTVLALAGLMAISANLTVRQHYKTSDAPMIPANTFAMVQTLSVIGVLALHKSPLHLLWLFPLSYLVGFLALRFKPLAFLPWLCGYLLSYTIPANW